jgi:hypothetical protein
MADAISRASGIIKRNWRNQGRLKSSKEDERLVEDIGDPEGRCLGNIAVPSTFVGVAFG